MRKEHQLEIGNEVEIEGRTYWITKVDGDTLDLMRDPDSYGRMRKKPQSGFWSTFLVIVLIAIILKLLF